jgi:hypothetical protein
MIFLVFSVNYEGSGSGAFLFQGGRRWWLKDDRAGLNACRVLQRITGRSRITRAVQPGAYMRADAVEILTRPKK